MEGNHRQESIGEGEEISEEQRRRAESNRLAAIARRRRVVLSDPSITDSHNQWRLSKCRKLDPRDIPSVLKEESSADEEVNAEKFVVRLEICSPDSFSATPVPAQGFVFPGEEAALQRLQDWLADVSPSHYTQNLSGGKSCVYKLWDYSPVVRYLRNVKGLAYEEIPWGTFNVVEKLSHSFATGFWMPCRPEHLSEEKVDELIGRLPRKIVETLLPFQLEGIRFGLRRGGRCLIADEMGLGKTLQAIALACCFKDEGSILVVCPAILRFSWAEELERWFPCLPTDIHLVFSHQDNPTHLKKWPKVVVISYKMLHHLRRSLVGRDWNFLVIDESHHLRCSKKMSEAEEIKVVLDLAAKVQRIVLLSGTPSLSRPYDIFHQINMLWPGLLGKDKFEFAKTYCDVKLTRDYQGNFFKDLSRGTRLDELNILLRQTVMIRRLKEHVMMHLPPKRRQIIGLLLKKSDIVSAKAAMTVDRIEALENDTVTEKANQSNGNYLNLNIIVRTGLGATTSCSGFEAWKQSLCNYIAKEVGIAKLSGFCEWLSLHPLISYPDDARDSGLNKNCHKMIIFAHHHKVLDGIQEFICQKGIEFVRIDGNTLPNDRQSAVNSFQISSEVKIAVIGITAGGVGLNLSSAQTVVFLELPPSSSWMLQGGIDLSKSSEAFRKHLGDELCDFFLDFTIRNMYVGVKVPEKNLQRQLMIENFVKNKVLQWLSKAEDRAHRQGQKNAVNIYYFCAKDTVDDTHWQYLNTSLYRVSSTTNGKRDAIREIGVDDISYFESSDLYDGILNKTLGKSTSGSLSPQHRIVSGLQQNAVLSDGCNETNLSNNVSDNQNQGQISAGFEGQPDDATEAKETNNSLVRSLRFEVSQYTERIHLYICTPESEYRPRPLFKSFRLEELDAKSSVIMNNDVAEVDESCSYTEVLLMFINQWKKLRPIQRRKLLGKPLQLPLAVELCYLKEGVNHDNLGLLKGKSKRRNTPFLEISRPLPDNAKWKKVSLAANHGRKEKEYIQGWSMIGEPLCKLCQSHCCGENALFPQFFEELFCNLDCYEEYRLRTSNRFLRQELFRIEHGVCTNCQLNCHHLVKCLKPLPVEKRREYIKINAPKLAMRKKLLEKLAKDPSDGNAWHADHIVPVFRGGGECQLENMRTLCVACHYNVTVAQRAESCTARANGKKRLKEILKALQNEGSVGTAANPKKGNVQEEIVEDELFVKIPGSAYSMQS